MGNTGGKKIYKHQQNESLMLNVLNHTLKYEIDNPTLKNAAFTYVKLSGDKAHLFVYVDTWDRSKITSLVNALNSAKGTFRTALANQTHFYKVPEIHFEIDKSIDQNLKIEEILNKIKDNT